MDIVPPTISRDPSLDAFLNDPPGGVEEVNDDPLGGAEEDALPDWLTDAATMVEATAEAAREAASAVTSAELRAARAEAEVEAARSSLDAETARSDAVTSSAKATAKEALARSMHTALSARKELEKARSTNEEMQKQRDTALLERARLERAHAAETHRADAAEADASAHALDSAKARTAAQWARASLSSARSAALAELDAAKAEVSAREAAAVAAGRWTRAVADTTRQSALDEAAEARAALEEAEASLTKLMNAAAEDVADEEEPDWLSDAALAVSLARTASDQLRLAISGAPTPSSSTSASAPTSPKKAPTAAKAPLPSPSAAASTAASAGATFEPTTPYQQFSQPAQHAARTPPPYSLHLGESSSTFHQVALDIPSGRQSSAGSEASLARSACSSAAASTATAAIAASAPSTPADALRRASMNAREAVSQVASLSLDEISDGLFELSSSCVDMTQARLSSFTEDATAAASQLPQTLRQLAAAPEDGHTRMHAVTTAVYDAMANRWRDAVSSSLQLPTAAILAAVAIANIAIALMLRAISRLPWATRQGLAITAEWRTHAPAAAALVAQSARLLHEAGVAERVSQLTVAVRETVTSVTSVASATAAAPLASLQRAVMGNGFSGLEVTAGAAAESGTYQSATVPDPEHAHGTYVPPLPPAAAAVAVPASLVPVPAPAAAAVVPHAAAPTAKKVEAPPAHVVTIDVNTPPTSTTASYPSPRVAPATASGPASTPRSAALSLYADDSV